LVGGSDRHGPVGEVDRLKAELERTKSNAETYRKLAEEFAAELETSDRATEPVSAET
jgi:hypothetical protein